ncbi:hypothetical protein [Lacticaseibacillus chiayiensis]|uniref:Uncharacterized protein n=1 Tax=Lacticaseibacillus chiayiensis TaxID=2100821 RepID=A0ABY6H7F7_9LACO|nr:hypothetical protein [Lacticaseibacillus chiayiensis]UYN57131.1 hypothetical protein OFW50_03235 [Lacticaseibacillus chiayiensis]
MIHGKMKKTIPRASRVTDSFSRSPDKSKQMIRLVDGDDKDDDDW